MDRSARFARPVPASRLAAGALPHLAPDARRPRAVPAAPSWSRPGRLASALETVVAGVAIVVAGALAGTLLAGCDSDGFGIGDYRGTIQVDGSTAPVEGEAVYTVVETVRGPRFVLGLFTGSLTDSDRDDYDFAALRRDGGRPGVGAYSVTTEGAGTRAFTASYARVADADDPEEVAGSVFRATEGVLTVTQVDDFGFVSGTFRFSGDGSRVENPRTRVTGEVSGTFEARYESPETLRSLGVDIGLDD
ncbi:MAG TPA: hypothetical protein VGB53_08795 [Rubricoccaceae bacterium]|jgi:hypothetical protein